jgi:hypothetical protein
MSRGPLVLFVLLMALATAAGMVLVASNHRPAQAMHRGQQFQHLLGGLGFGPARDLQRCAFAFDPRLSPSCSEDGGPVPAGASFCPYHACSILDYPPWPRDEGTSRDAQIP